MFVTAIRRNEAIGCESFPEPSERDDKERNMAEYIALEESTFPKAPIVMIRISLLTLALLWTGVLVA